MRELRIALVGLLVVTAAGPSAGAEAPALLCAPAKVRGSGDPALDLAVTDRFALREVRLGRPSSVCWAETPGDATFAGVSVRTRPRKARKLGVDVDVVTRFGRQPLVVKSLAGLLMPSSDDAASPAVPPRACYAVRGDRPGTTRLRVAVTDASGERVFDLGRPTRLCVATGDDDAPDVVCHAVKLARTTLSQASVRLGAMTLSSELGTHDLKVGTPRELCVAALSSDPGPGPESGFRLEITPREMTIFTTTPVTATAHFDDGRSEDWSRRVDWLSSDPTVVRMMENDSSVNGAWVVAESPGTAVLSVTDTATGVTSTETGGDANVTVTWPLERLEILPKTVSRLPGQEQNYFVRGVFPGGVTKNLTKQVVYATSDPTVATVSNVPPTRSQVTAVGVGVATISATDPISGISTTDSDSDATFRVRETISYLVVTSNLRYSSRFPGESQRFTATGYFSDGTPINLTQKCLWASSEPSVAAAPNDLHDASRIDAVAPGITFVSCKDWDSGQTSSVAFWVLGDLQAIRVNAGLKWIELPRIGGSVVLSAIGQYAGGGERNLTQEVVWGTRDPEIALCPNAPGDRSRITSLGGGHARIYATDTASGVVSDDEVVVMLGELERIRVQAPYPYYKFDAIPVGTDTRFRVIGEFEYGSINLSHLDSGYVLESSDPSVAEITSERLVRAIAPGTFELTARDIETGVVSAPFTVRVVGALDSITLTPATVTRGIGEWDWFTAIGHYPPGIDENLTHQLQYTSSDPSVAVFDVGGPVARVRTVGPGTATITATHLATGTTATATVTVVPGTIERITVEPASVVRNPGNHYSFTAIGHYPDGRTINVTPVVTWASLSPEIAEASNDNGARSRVLAKASGTAVIVAHHPSGVTSHDTGDDGALVVKDLVSLELTPEEHVGPAGTTKRYTLVGTFDDATNINLTQDAYYWVDDPAVARADNVEGDRSAVELLAPGSTTVRATFANWTPDYPLTSGDEATASLAVEP